MFAFMEREVLESIRARLSKAKRVVFLGGAGVSTASGIPDFRSEEGIAKTTERYGIPYETILSHRFFFEHTDLFYDFYWSSMVHEDAKPNLAHRVLKEYGDRHILFIVTQNIDGLHELAGSQRVIPVHGTIHSYTCTCCGRKATLDEIPHHGVPMCPICHAPFKPDVVLYGEPLGEEELMGAKAATEYADALIVGGTSLQVYPINALPRFFSGSLSILINRDETPLDDWFDFVIHEDVGTALSAILEGL